MIHLTWTTLGLNPWSVSINRSPQTIAIVSAKTMINLTWTTGIQWTVAEEVGAPNERFQKYIYIYINFHHFRPTISMFSLSLHVWFEYESLSKSVVWVCEDSGGGYVQSDCNEIGQLQEFWGREDETGDRKARQEGILIRGCDIRHNPSLVQLLGLCSHGSHLWWLLDECTVSLLTYPIRFNIVILATSLQIGF